MKKILTWLSVNLASLIGMFQAVLKCVKEILTAVVNLLSVLVPASSAQALVLKIRAVVEAVDAFVEKYKAMFLSVLK